jgi:hypothetical protein
MLAVPAAGESTSLLTGESTAPDHGTLASSHSSNRVTSILSAFTDFLTSAELDYWALDRLSAPKSRVSVFVSFVVVRLGSVTATDSLVEHEPDADDRP